MHRRVPPSLSAAGVVWRRHGAPEVLLARRRPRMRFFGGVHAFCGGRVDPVDRQMGASRTGSESLVTTLRSALARELLEELSLDLRTGEAASPALVERLRDDPGSWARECHVDQLAGLPEPSLRLVTPEFYPRRFDTWFFVARVSDGFEPRLCEEELDGGGFDGPARWLERWRRGEFLLAPPTVVMLRALSSSPPEEWETALGAVQSGAEDPARLPEIRTDPAVRLLPLRTPTLPPARHTNAYLVGHRRAWLVDPATPWPDGRAILRRTLEAEIDAGATLQGILLTHHHADHVGAASAMADHFDVPVAAHPETARRLRGRVAVHLTLEEGTPLEFEHVDGSAGRLVAVFTPGHAPGHLSFHEPRYGSLVAGDMVSTLSSILIDPEDGDLGQYMASLRRLAAMRPRSVFPAHGPADSASVIEDQIAHREARTAAVLSTLARGRIALDVLTQEVWGDVPRPMLGYARRSATSILVQLDREGRIRFDGETARLA